MMPEQQSRLACYLDKCLRRPFAYGRTDCALFAADWVLDATGKDAGAPFRGRYTTALGCQRLLKRSGGLEWVFTEAAEGIGLVRTSSPKLGDVGLISALTPWGVVAVGSICVGARWVVRSPNGLISAALEPLAAWRF